MKAFNPHLCLVLFFVIFSSFGNLSAQPGEGLDFDGINDQVNVPNGPSLSISGNITMEGWVYAVKNTGVQNTMCKSSLSQNTGYIFPRTNDGWVNFIVYYHIGGSWRTLQAPYGTLNSWHHLAAVWDGTNIFLYMDGVLVATSPPYSGLITINTNPLTIGTQPGYAEVFGGKLDECRIWTTARTQCEINTYKDCEIPTNAPGLIANYHFNQGIAGSNNTSITTLIDATSNGNSGPLANFALNGASSNWIAPTGVVSGSIIPLPAPTVSFIASQTLVCSNNTVSLSGTGTSYYAWTGVPNGTPFFINSTSSFTVTGTHSLTTCTNTAVATISVIPAPTVSFTASQTQFCNNGIVTLTGTGANIYTWTAGVGNGLPFSISTTTSYTVTGTNTVNSCSNNAVATITVFPLPNVGIIKNPPFVCNSGTVTLSGTGANNYAWTGGISNGVSFPINTTTTYTVTGTNSLTTCSNTAVTTVTVHPLPSLSIIANPPFVCTSGTVTLTGTGATNYTWTGGITNGAPFQISSTTSYTVKGTNTVTTCSNTAVATVSVFAAPVISITVSKSTVCKGNKVTLTGTGTDTYSWTGGIANGVAFPINSTTTYTVIGTNSVTTCSNTAVANIVVFSCLSIHDLSTPNTELSFYPNPNNGEITVSVLELTSNPRIEIYDCVGKLVYQENVVSEKQIARTNLATGIYSIKLIKDNSVISVAKMIRN